MKPGKILTFSIASLILLLLASCSGTNTTGTPTPESQTSTSALEDITVSASGEVVPHKWVNLSFPSGGQYLKILVEPGESVAADTLLATVNDLSAIATRDAASAQLANANTQLANAKAQLANAKAQLASAKASLERLKVAEFPNLDIAAGEESVTAAEEGITAAEQVVSAAEASIPAAESNLELANQALEDTKLHSPFKGFIVDVNGHDGEFASPGQPLIVLADFSTLQVQTTDMSEVDAMRVHVGDVVKVSFDALPNINITGKVLQIALKKSLGSGVYYTVNIALDTIPDDLRWGMSAFVVITTEK
jgi:multidrug efflux pump subunit AcrA (membrane-fusion protein)